MVSFRNWFIKIIANPKNRIFVFVAGFIIVGAVVALIIAQAATSSFGIEPEDGNKAGSITVVNDASASGGKAIQFGGNPSIGTSKFISGVTATHDSKTYTALIGQSSQIANQHFYSFGGAGADENWKSLDFRINNLLRDYGNNVVLTACCSPPDLAQSPPPTKPTDTPIKWVPDPDGIEDYNQATINRQTYYTQYASLIAQAVNRYSKIQYVQVWNEMKGYFEKDFYAVSGHAGGNNYKKYTILYNLIYDAVKSARSSVNVGGPYVVMHSLSKDRPWAKSSLSGTNWGYIDKRDVASVEYWWNNKHGADFVALDIKNHNDCTDPNTSDCDPETSADPFSRMDKYQAVVDWVRKADSQGGLGAANTPIIWSEWYARNNPIIQNAPPDDIRHSDSSNKAYQGTIAQRNALMAAGLAKVVKSGAITALIWGTQGLGDQGVYHPLAIYNSSLIKTPFYDTQKCVKDYFSNGTELYESGNTNQNVEVLTSNSRAMLVNKTGSNQQVTVYGNNNQSYTLEPYQVLCQPVTR